MPLPGVPLADLLLWDYCEVLVGGPIIAGVSAAERRTTTSGGAEVVVGIVFASIGSALLALSRRLVGFYREMGREGSSWIALLSAYAVPAAFVIFGLAAIVRGATR